MASFAKKVVQVVLSRNNIQVCSLLSNGKTLFPPLSGLHSSQSLPRWKNSHTRFYSSYKLPTNTVVMFVPQQEAWVVERMGKFHKILDPVRESFWLILFFSLRFFLQGCNNP